jgi:phosphoenolpyruvate carboxykinase (ATP)
MDWRCLYGTGSQEIEIYCSMITAALNGELDNVAYKKSCGIWYCYPQECPNVPSEILNPRNTWEDRFIRSKSLN